MRNVHGESADEAYIVMQYVPGRSLDRVIAQGTANVPLVLSVGIQIADGLSAAHQIGRVEPKRRLPAIGDLTFDNGAT